MRTRATLVMVGTAALLGTWQGKVENSEVSFTWDPWSADGSGRAGIGRPERQESACNSGEIGMFQAETGSDATGGPIGWLPFPSSPHPQLAAPEGGTEQ